MEVPEIDPNFEPISRARSNTWPLRPQEFSVPKPDGNQDDTSNLSIPEVTTEHVADHQDLHDVAGVKQEDHLGISKKSTSRRNAWGNLSYADLITKAIESSPEKRLTLSQIYDWMVQNVPYFKDKGDSNSSAGWKNSIRHNLSLHSRFMRIQNEGTGKSSWWVINPDAKPGKSPRRRATSMDTKAYEKKRGRVKKKVEQLRAALEGSPGGGSPDRDYLPDSPLHAYQLSPEFRARTNSNASSCGRLSPISAALEPDLHDSQVPPMSPIQWDANLNNYTGQDRYTDQLTDSLADMMKIGESGSLSPMPGYGDGMMNDGMMNGGSGSRGSPMPQPQFTTLQNATNYSSLQQYTQQNNGYGSSFDMPAPPPYPDSIRRSPQQVGTSVNGRNTFINMPDSLCNVDTLYQPEPILQQDPMMSTPNTVSGNTMNRFIISSQSAFSGTGGGVTMMQQPRPQPQDSLLRAALSQPNKLSVRAPQMGQMGGNQGYQNQSVMGLQNQQTFPTDLDFPLDSLQAEAIECDVDQVIRQELSIDGNLDFTFDQFQNVQPQNTGTADSQNLVH